MMGSTSQNHGSSYKSGDDGGNLGTRTDGSTGVGKPDGGMVGRDRDIILVDGSETFAPGLWCVRFRATSHRQVPL